MMIVARFIEDVFKKSINNQVCIVNAEITLKIVKISIYFYSSCVISMGSYIIYRGFLIEDTEFVLPSIVPGTDLENMLSGAATKIMHVCYITFGCWVACLFDSVIVSVFLNMLTVSTIMEEQIFEFQALLRNGTKNNLKPRNHFIRIITMYQKYTM